MASNALRRTLLWTIAARVAIVTILLGCALVAEVLLPQAGRSQLFALIVVSYVLGVAYALTVSWTERHRWFIDAQLAADALLITAFVGATGSVESYGFSMYALPVIGASVLRSRRSALVVAVLSSAAYAGMVFAQYFAQSLLPASWRSPAWLLPPGNVAGYTVGLNVFGLLAVALLSGSLARRLQRADARLVDASTELAQLQALNQHVIDSLASGLVTTDSGGRVLTFNRAATSITGLVPQDAIGRPVAEVLQVPVDKAASFGMDLSRGGRWPDEIRYRRGDGRVVEIGLSATHLVTPEQRGGLVINFQDITDLKRTEREARAQQRLAALGEMAAGIAHEIRNPLASISGSIQVLRGELVLTSEQRELMNIVLRESERLNGIINAFLDYARPRELAVKRLDLAGVVRDTAVLLRNSTEVGSTHTVEVDVPQQGVWYAADECQIRQILWNLATNGLRAMPHGGRLLLRTRQVPPDGTELAGQDGHGAILVVEDEGTGIPQEEMERIFQPFYRRSPSGTGLGLAIVHRLVSDHGGRIDVESSPGAGTRITVTLPGKDRSSAAAKPGCPGSQGAVRRKALSTARVAGPEPACLMADNRQR
ncbi:MAG: nitrogen regulation protein NR(II) [Vicinamibacterales bacterium]